MVSGPDFGSGGHDHVVVFIGDRDMDDETCSRSASSCRRPRSTAQARLDASSSILASRGSQLESLDGLRDLKTASLAANRVDWYQRRISSRDLSRLVVWRPLWACLDLPSRRLHGSHVVLDAALFRQPLAGNDSALRAAARSGLN